MTMQVFSNYVGIIGVLFVLQSYLWLQLGKWHQSTLSFSVVNLLGSIFIITSLYYHFNLASFIIEVVWMLISVYGILRYYNSVDAG